MEALTIGACVPDLAELERRTQKPPAKPSAEGKKFMRAVLEKVGYLSLNREVYDTIVGYGALLFDGTAAKGLLLSGGVGIGKSFGAEILARLSRFTITTPGELSAKLAEANGNLVRFGQIVTGWGDLCEQPRDIVIDEFGARDCVRIYGETISLMAEVVDIRYRAFIRYGKLTVLTTNLTGDEIRQRYGDRVLDRLREMCFCKFVTGKSLR